MNRTLARSLAALALVAVPAVASAQAASTPFRAGQWGTEFSATNSINLLGFDETQDLQFAFPSVGFLKFRSPNAAWLVDASLSYSSLSAEIDGEDAGDQDAMGIGLRVGTRSYRPLTGRALAFTSFGGTAGYGSIDEEGGETTITNVGAFGEIGGSYMVTNHLSLGASFGGTLGYQSRKEEDSFGGEFEVSGFRLALGQTRLLVTLYF